MRSSWSPGLRESAGPSHVRGAATLIPELPPVCLTHTVPMTSAPGSLGDDESDKRGCSLTDPRRKDFILALNLRPAYTGSPSMAGLAARRQPLWVWAAPRPAALVEALPTLCNGSCTPGIPQSLPPLHHVAFLSGHLPHRLWVRPSHSPFPVVLTNPTLRKQCLCVVGHGYKENPSESLSQVCPCASV